ncbi:hypothetical protein [Nostoc commune]|uniref:hypothetical protein n=1 Tax=Nostoc commune TaxID=1178 RepID=UPI001FD10E93|nr:hypothetical protein [Nostoc commune]
MWKSTLYEGGLPQIGSIPDSIPEIAINEGRPRYTFYPSEIGTTEINIFPYNKLPFNIAENSVSHSSTTEIDINKTTFKINATEVNTSEKTFTFVLNSSSSKISPSSSIEAQQFLGVYTHLYTFSLITTYCSKLAASTPCRETLYFPTSKTAIAGTTEQGSCTVLAAESFINTAFQGSNQIFINCFSYLHLL